MDMWVFFEVVVPLLELDDTCLIAVTTVLDDENFYSKILDLTDEHGKPLFNYLNFELGCNRPRCRANPIKCWHNIGMLPPWHSKRKHGTVRNILKAHPDLMLREAMYVEKCFVLCFFSREGGVEGFYAKKSESTGGGEGEKRRSNDQSPGTS